MYSKTQVELPGRSCDCATDISSGRESQDLAIEVVPSSRQNTRVPKKVVLAGQRGSASGRGDNRQLPEWDPGNRSKQEDHLTSQQRTRKRKRRTSDCFFFCSSSTYLRAPISGRARGTSVVAGKGRREERERLDAARSLRRGKKYTPWRIDGL